MQKKNACIVVFTQCFMFFCLVARSQEICPKNKVIKTDSLGNVNQKIHLPLNFFFKEDSISVCMDSKGNNIFIAFKVVGKKCKWNSDYTIGQTIYQVVVKEKGAEKEGILTINLKAKNNGFI